MGVYRTAKFSFPAVDIRSALLHSFARLDFRSCGEKQAGLPASSSSRYCTSGEDRQSGSNSSDIWCGAWLATEKQIGIAPDLIGGPSRTGTRPRINALGWLTGPNPLIGRKRLYLVLAHRRDQLCNAMTAFGRSAGTTMPLAHSRAALSPRPSPPMKLCRRCQHEHRRQRHHHRHP